MIEQSLSSILKIKDFKNLVQYKNENYTYIAGNTSDDFATINKLNRARNKMFLIKLNDDNQNIEYSTFIGGSDEDIPLKIILDEDNNILLIGLTNSVDFPTWNSFQNRLKGIQNSFVLKIDPTQNNSLLFSSYLGGGNYDIINDVNIKNNFIYLSGCTNSPDFPTTKNALQRSLKGDLDAFITKIGLNQRGETYIDYSTFYGGEKNDGVNSICIDEDEIIYITGFTNSVNDFPLKKEYQSKLKGDYNAFISKIDLKQNLILYSSYLGGSSRDLGEQISIKNSQLYILGKTSSKDFVKGENIRDEAKFGLIMDTRKNGENSLISSKMLTEEEIQVFIPPYKIESIRSKKEIDHLADSLIQKNEDFSLPKTEQTTNQPQVTTDIKLKLEQPNDYIYETVFMGGESVNYPMPKILNATGEVQLIAMPPPGSFFPPGITPITISAIDDSGETDYCYFDVIVRVNKSKEDDSKDHE